MALSPFNTHVTHLLMFSSSSPTLRPRPLSISLRASSQRFKKSTYAFVSTPNPYLPFSTASVIWPSTTSTPTAALLTPNFPLFLRCNFFSMLNAPPLFSLRLNGNFFIVLSLIVLRQDPFPIKILKPLPKLSPNSGKLSTLSLLFNLPLILNRLLPSVLRFHSRYFLLLSRLHSHLRLPGAHLKSQRPC